MSAELIDCSTAVTRLWDFVERELDDVDQAEVEKHLAFCRRCCGEAEFVEELRAFMRDAAGPKLPDEPRRRLSEFVAELEGGERS